MRAQNSPCVLRLTVVAMFPPFSAAKSTVTEPAFIRSTASSGMSNGAGRPGINAVEMMMSLSAAAAISISRSAALYLVREKRKMKFEAKKKTGRDGKSKAQKNEPTIRESCDTCTHTASWNGGMGGRFKHGSNVGERVERVCSVSSKVLILLFAVLIATQMNFRFTKSPDVRHSDESGKRVGKKSFLNLAETVGGVFLFFTTHSSLISLA